jgi:hypothetical protein
MHEGVDFVGYADVHAVLPGTVTAAGWFNGAAGNGVIVIPDGHANVEIRDFHAASVAVRKGDRVAAGQRIAKAGARIEHRPVPRRVHEHGRHRDNELSVRRYLRRLRPPAPRPARAAVGRVPSFTRAARGGRRSRSARRGRPSRCIGKPSSRALRNCSRLLPTRHDPRPLAGRRGVRLVGRRRRSQQSVDGGHTREARLGARTPARTPPRRRGARGGGSCRSPVHCTPSHLRCVPGYSGSGYQPAGALTARSPPTRRVDQVSATGRSGARDAS